jgi:hypothetical protein
VTSENWSTGYLCLSANWPFEIVISMPKSATQRMPALAEHFVVDQLGTGPLGPAASRLTDLVRAIASPTLNGVTEETSAPIFYVTNIPISMLCLKITMRSVPVYRRLFSLARRAPNTVNYSKALPPAQGVSFEIE